MMTNGKTSSELSELIYEDYGKFQVLNEANIIRTDEEIKELFNCKGEWEVTDGVTDMSFQLLIYSSIGGTTYGFNRRNVDKQTTKKNN